MATAIAKRDPRDFSFPGFTLSATGMQVEGDPTFDEWLRVGHLLERIEGAAQWWVGDWLNFGDGRPQWGDKYEQAISIFNRSYDTIAQYKWVAKNVEFCSRLQNLSWSHHQEVADLDPEEQKELLAAAAPEAPDKPPRMTREELRREVRQRRLAQRPDAPPLPKSKFNLIYADPPWRYDYSKSDSRKIENQYPTLEVDEICELPIAKSCADDCVLFLWATSPKLPEAMRVVVSWGFTYRTCMVWVKDKIGMGYYARQRHELLLIATTGEPSVPDESVRPDSVIQAPRGEHSRKPDSVYAMLESMYPKSKYLELFCRTPRKGWKAWGNE
jgi:N6-adenosine-specific RNA methylase IME4